MPHTKRAGTRRRGHRGAKRITEEYTLDGETEQASSAFEAVYFDMDGTIADLYGVRDWLTSIVNEETRPYDNAPPMFDREHFHHVLINLKQRGIHIGILTWLSKDSTAEYAEEVTAAKKEWLRKHVPFIDEAKFIPYGEDKTAHADVKSNSILIDDDERNATFENESENRKFLDAKDRRAMFSFLEWLAYEEQTG